MSKNSQTFLFVVAGLASVVLGVWLAVRTLEPAPSPGYPKLGGEFTLQSIEGPVSLSDYRGKIVTLYFGYTFCPDICPTSLGVLSHAFRQLPAEQLEQLQGIFISVDPERDTPERLADYAPHFHPQILGATGSPETIAEVAKRYAVFYEKVDMGDSAMGYSVDHTSTIFVVGRDGIIRSLVHHSNSPEAVLKALKAAFNE